jgi:hypothetical protein
VGDICIRGVGEEPEGGGFDGTRGLGGSEGNVSVIEGDGEGVQFSMMSGAQCRFRQSRVDEPTRFAQQTTRNRTKIPKRCAAVATVVGLDSQAQHWNRCSGVIPVLVGLAEPQTPQLTENRDDVDILLAIENLEYR